MTTRDRPLRMNGNSHPAVPMAHAPAPVEPPKAPLVLAAVAPWHVRQLWPTVRSYIMAGYHEVGLDVDEHALLVDIERQLLQLWVVMDGSAVRAALITKLINGAKGRICQLDVAGGEGLKEILPLGVGIETYARAEHCGKMRVQGRPGWERVLSRFGFERVGVILERELT